MTVDVNSIKKMMQQAQEIQKKVQQAQEELDSIEVVGSAGGAGYIVEVTINGKGSVKRINISDSLIDLEEKSTLEDLIAAAFNNAKNKLDAIAGEKMSDLGLPTNLMG
jgi:DNA-binding YbaB/EbfC family protein